jgi:hypothetical protein
MVCLGGADREALDRRVDGPSRTETISQRLSAEQPLQKARPIVPNRPKGRGPSPGQGVR